MAKKVIIELDDWSYNCSDGCCTSYGTTTIVNGKEMCLNSQDTGTIVKQILEELGYNVEIIEKYNGER